MRRMTYEEFYKLLGDIPHTPEDQARIEALAEDLNRALQPKLDAAMARLSPEEVLEELAIGFGMVLGPMFAEAGLDAAQVRELVESLKWRIIARVAELRRHRDS